MHEHRLIERMLAILKKELESAAEHGRVDSALIDTATDFIRTYADRCHHGKEEDILFRRLTEKDLDDSVARTMAELIEDHVRGRALTRQLIEANERYAGGDTTALGEIETVMQELVEFYPVHIEKEDHHFFKPALAYFGHEEQADILRDYDEFDRALIHEKYLSVVEGLEDA
jgi:hemerythrin-like domain-containing protein